MSIAGAYARDLTPHLYPIQLCFSTADHTVKADTATGVARLHRQIGNTPRAAWQRRGGRANVFLGSGPASGLGAGRMWGIRDGVLVGGPVRRAAGKQLRAPQRARACLERGRSISSLPRPALGSSGT